MKQLIDYLNTENPILSELYKICEKTPSDINGHFSRMLSLAKECDHITEFGARFGVSTVCWLYSKPRRFVTYDIDPKETIKKIGSLSEGTEFEFNHKSSTEVKIEQTDLLFIDSLHCYSHIKKELSLHHKKVNKYIVIHDTETFGNIAPSKSKYGLEGSLETKGLKPAIKEFLEEKNEWRQFEHHSHCNGLTILKKNNVRYSDEDDPGGEEQGTWWDK